MTDKLLGKSGFGVPEHCLGAKTFGEASLDPLIAVLGVAAFVFMATPTRIWSADSWRPSRTVCRRADERPGAAGAPACGARRRLGCCRHVLARAGGRSRRDDRVDCRTEDGRPLSPGRDATGARLQYARFPAPRLPDLQPSGRTVAVRVDGHASASRHHAGVQFWEERHGKDHAAVRAARLRWFGRGSRRPDASLEPGDHVRWRRPRRSSSVLDHLRRHRARMARRAVPNMRAGMHPGRVRRKGISGRKAQARRAS